MPTIRSDVDGVKVGSTLVDMRRLMINNYGCTVAILSLTKIIPMDARPSLDLMPMESYLVDVRRS